MAARNPLLFPILLLALLLAGLCCPTTALYAQAAGKKDFPDYRNPPRAYEEVTLDGRKFIVEQQLLSEEPVLAQKALARLKKNIDLALALTPPSAHKHVAKQQFWLLYGPKAEGGGRDNGLSYFRPDSPKFDGV